MPAPGDSRCGAWHRDGTPLNTSVEMQTRSWDVLTFDCYGTLVDWEAGILSAFAAEAARRGLTPPSADHLLAAYHEIEPQVQATTFMRYRDVLTETATRIMERIGWESGDARFLADSVAAWPPFPDTNAALLAIAARGYSLGILSNVDRDLLAGTRLHLDADFAFIVTAEDVRAYKPARAHFDAARTHTRGARWLHIAQSWFHDIMPARQLGIPTVWVNRKAEPLRADARPLGVVGDVAALDAWLAATEA
jgi:2-haloalkanoic acid dehalogenase type II